jgi:hypothetical protein
VHSSPEKETFTLAVALYKKVVVFELDQSARCVSTVGYYTSIPHPASLSSDLNLLKPVDLTIFI